MKKLIIISLVAGFVIAASPVMAVVTIDFEDTPSGTFSSWIKEGVTFTAVGGGLLTSDAHGPTPNGTNGIAGDVSPYPELRADIAGGTNYVAVDLGDYNYDLDRLFLEVFDSSAVSLGFTDLVIPDDFVGMETLSLSASNIAYAIFGARDADLGSSVHADNFTFEPSAIIPVPGAVVLGGIGVGLVGWLRRRRAL